MAYQDFERDIIGTFMYDVKNGYTESTIEDLKNPKAERKYKEYLDKVASINPRELSCNYTDTISNDTFGIMADHLFQDIFSEKLNSEYTDLVEHHLCVNYSDKLMEGVSLKIIDPKDFSKVINVMEVPDFSHVSSIVCLMHEYVHYHFQAANINTRRKKYYDEILPIFVEKVTAKMLKDQFDINDIEQIVHESRLETINWHYFVHPKEVKFLLDNLPKLKRSAEKGDFTAKFSLDKLYETYPCLQTAEGTQYFEMYNKHLAAAYGIGYLFSESLFEKYMEDEALGKKLFNSVLLNEMSLEELLKYYNIYSANRSVYEVAEGRLKLVKENRGLIK